MASARFGVTTEYLVRAEELEIKIVQGAKPGEGGQLPGHKVTELIARLRHAVPGIPLISPPPHHDIYSIEDLAQLITRPQDGEPARARRREAGRRGGRGHGGGRRGKAYADYVLIAGHNGGTGASPLSSIKHAGSPWELGLAETQATLVRNGLRHRIEVRTDGGLKTGRDVVIAALLGAESYGFGTAPLVALGCAMARQCHINTCPTGIATQRDDLRAKFKGTPEQVIAYFTLVAEEVRAILASLGARTLEEVIGRNDLLVRVEHPDVPRAQLLDLSMLLAPPKGAAVGDAASAPRRGTTGRVSCRSIARSSRNWRRTSRAGCRSPATTRSATTTSRWARGCRARSRERFGDAGPARGSDPAPLHRQRRTELRRVPLPRACTSSSRARPTTTSARGCRAARSPSGLPARGVRRASRTSTSCWATRRSTAPPAACSSPRARPATASRCATRARPR